MINIFNKICFRNPSEVVSRMYTMATVDDDADEDHGNGDDANNLEGYLERLPPGKKKSTIWWEFYQTLVFDDCSDKLDRLQLNIIVSFNCKMV